MANSVYILAVFKAGLELKGEQGAFNAFAAFVTAFQSMN